MLASRQPTRLAPRTLECGTAAGRSMTLRVLSMAKKGAAGGKKEKKEAPAKVEAPRPLPYLSAETIFHTMYLLDSYKRTTGRTLMSGLTLQDAPKALFEAPFAVVSHDTQDDPIFNYGNAAALNLWEMDWGTLTSTPSRQSAQDDPAIQQERAQLLANVKEKGFSDGYQGIRVTAKGRRFRIEGVTLWTVSTGKAAGMEGEQGRVLGQAAVFTELTWLDDGETPEMGKAGEKWCFGPGGVLMKKPEGAAEAAAPAAPAAAAAAAPAAAPTEADVAAAKAAADEQGNLVRELKKKKDGTDPEVQAAVKVLLERKAALAALEEAVKKM